MSLRLISFDLDGTLLDTAAEIAEAANRTLLEFGLPARAPAHITTLIGGGARELMLKLLAQALLQQPQRAADVRPEAVLARMAHHLEAVAGQLSRPYAGALPVLRSLRAQGLKLACVSNKEARHARHLLQVHRMEELFDVVVGGDTLPWKKPDGRVLRTVLARLNVAPHEAVHVGDSAVDVQAARQAGVGAWAVSYGYNGGRPVSEAQPQHLFNSLAEVAGQIGREAPAAIIKEAA